MVCLASPPVPPLRLLRLPLAAGFSVSSAPFAFGKMLLIAELGFGSEAIGYLVQLSLSPIPVIQNSLQPASCGHLC